MTENSAHNITSQILTNVVTATYTHTLAVTGRLVGEYECTVSNNKPSSASRMLEVVGKNLVPFPDLTHVASFWQLTYSPPEDRP